MRQKGKLRSWNDDRGFGFIVPNEGGKDVFLHMSALRNRDRRPEAGQIVTYALSSDDQGRPRATNATLPGDRLPVRKKKKSWTVAAMIITGIFLALVALSVIAGKISPLVLLGYLLVSLVTFYVYAYDKTAARDGAWRTKESTLHLLALAGGWPGALIAQQKLRHKSKKELFRIVFWMTVMMNLIMFAWLFTASGAGKFQSWVDEGRSLLGSGQRATIEWADPNDQLGSGRR